MAARGAQRTQSGLVASLPQQVRLRRAYIDRRRSTRVRTQLREGFFSFLRAVEQSLFLSRSAAQVRRGMGGAVRPGVEEERQRL